MTCIKISDDINSDPKPIISVVGWSIIREEVSLNLAEYLITRIGKDDSGDLHPSLMSTSCSVTQFQEPQNKR